MILKTRRLITIFLVAHKGETRPSGCLRQIVAANIRRHRKARGLSQQNFAFDIEMDRTYFGGIERGERNVSIDNIERIAKGLGINAHLLLMDRDDSADEAK